jgi:hypothetical protein
MLREATSGSFGRELEKLAAWVIRTYNNKTEGLTESWELLLRTVQGHGIGGKLLQAEEIVCVPMPATCSSSTLRPHCFRFPSSCPILLNGFDPRALQDLACVLVADLNRKFSVPVNPELLVKGETVNNKDTKSFSNHLVVLGASNAKRLVPVLKSCGFSLTDLSRPGWMATEENVTALIEELKSLNSAQTIPLGAGIVLDLLGNVSYRYEQFDGSTALLYKEGYWYHFAGKIPVCPEQNYKYILNLLAPIFLSAQDSLKVVFPPMPRHLETPCCGNPSHSTNVKDEGHSLTLLDKITGLRNTLKIFLLERGVKNFWLLDGIAAVQGIPPPEKKGSNRDSIPDVLPHLSADGVHLTDSGYRHVATTVIKTFIQLRDGKIVKLTTADSVSAVLAPRKDTHYWRGFVSPVGCPGNNSTQSKLSAHRFHPYSKQRGGGKHRNQSPIQNSEKILHIFSEI